MKVNKASLVGLALVMLVCCGRGYSEGERSGTVYKLSYKGLLWKSYEGTMHLGTAAPNQSGTMTPDDWNFTVRDESVARRIQALNEKGSRVTVKYVQWFVSPCTMDTDYEVVDVAEAH